MQLGGVLPLSSTSLPGSAGRMPRRKIPATSGLGLHSSKTTTGSYHPVIPSTGSGRLPISRPQEAKLLSQLLRRLLYFGRAESYCRFRIFDEGAMTPNCRLERSSGAGQPVLVAIPGGELNLESLFAVTDSDLLRQRRIPPGTAWYYATIPPRKPAMPTPVARRRHPPAVRALQFAVGGRVYPSDAHWVNLTERFREAVIRQRCLQVSLWRTHLYGELTGAERDALSLIRGLDSSGNRVDGRTTTFFALIPDSEGHPTRLISWRESPFTDDEIDAFLVATEKPFVWERHTVDWRCALFLFHSPSLCRTSISPMGISGKPLRHLFFQVALNDFDQTARFAREKHQLLA